MKHFALVLGICFAASFLLLGCTQSMEWSNNDSQAFGSINAGTATPSETPTATAGAFGQPTAIASQDASATPMPTAVDDEYLNSEGYKQLKQMALEGAQKTLGDPKSSIDNLLVAAQVFKNYQLQGLDVDEMLEKIHARILELLKTTQLCKKQYENIDEKAIALGFDEAANIAKNRALSADVYCSSASYVFDDKDSTTRTAITASAEGNLKEYTLLGVTISDEARSYYFEEGKLDWTYEFQERQESACILYKRTGSGTVELKNFLQGAVTLNSNGEYEGSFTVRVPVTVNEIKLTDVIVQEGDPNPCDTAKPRNLQEEEDIHIEFRGNTTDMKLLSGQFLDGGNTPELNDVWHSETNWNMKIP